MGLKELTIKLLGNKKPLLVNDPVDEIKDCKKILLLRQDRIGDVLITVPFLNALKELAPDARIDMLLSHRNLGAERAIENKVDTILTLKRGIKAYFAVIYGIRKQKYDLVIDLLDNSSTTSTIITRFSNTPYKLGFDKENRKVYTHIVNIPDKTKHHIIDRLFNLLIPFTDNLEKFSRKLTYQIFPAEQMEATKLMGEKTKKLRLGINLSGSNDEKNWGKGNYIAFLKNLNELNKLLEVRLFSTPDNEDELSEIEDATNAKRAPLVNSFNNYAALLKTCDIVLTPDTAAVHLCSAFEIPCIALFTTSTDPNKGMPWTPQNKLSKVLTADQHGPLELITVTEVIESLNEIIEEMGG